MTKFFIRIPTADGPRTIITNVLNIRDASLLRTALAVRDLTVAVVPPHASRTLGEHMALHKRALKRAAAKQLGIAKSDTKVVGIRSAKP